MSHQMIHIRTLRVQWLLFGQKTEQSKMIKFWLKKSLTCSNPPPITTCLPRSSHHPIWLSSTQRWLRGCDSWALVASIAIAVVVAGHFLCTFDIYLMHHYATVSGNKGTEHFRVEDTVRLRKISALAFVISVSFSFWNMIRKTLN